MVAALQSVFAVFQSLLYAILGTIQAVFAALWGAISGVARTFAGLTKFLLSMYLPF
jgi:phage-related protein